MVTTYQLTGSELVNRNWREVFLLLSKLPYEYIQLMFVTRQAEFFGLSPLAEFVMNDHLALSDVDIPYIELDSITIFSKSMPSKKFGVYDLKFIKNRLENLPIEIYFFLLDEKALIISSDEIRIKNADMLSIIEIYNNRLKHDEWLNKITD